jgi:hypothetical protein
MADLVPNEPPKGLADWCNKKRKVNLLIYKVGYYYEPLEDRNKKCVKCKCTVCGAVTMQEYTKLNNRIGFIHSETGKEIFGNKETTCPECGKSVTAEHVSCFGSRNGTVIERYWPVTFHNVNGNVAVLQWCGERRVDRTGKDELNIYQYSGAVFSKTEKIRLTGFYSKWWNRQCFLGKWETRKTFTDRVEGVNMAEIYQPEEIPNVLKGTFAENSKVDIYLQCSDTTYPVTYLRLYQRYPNVENLIMNGLGGYLNKLIQSSMSYTKTTPTLKNFKGLKLKKAKPNEILGISKEALRCIKQNEWDSSKIDLYVHTHTQGVTLQNIDRIVHKYGSRIEPLIGTGADIPKTMRYIEKQNKNLEDAGTYYNRVQYIVDYWNMLRKNGHYTTDTDILYPQNLVKSHNDEQRIMQIAATKELAKDFKKQYNKLKKYCFTCGGLSIHPAETEIEMIDEGRELHHCVATYAKRHASGKTAIFFIRHINEPDKPYFTLEFNFDRMYVIQNRGLRNCERTQEVQDFEKNGLSSSRTQPEQKKKGK